MSEDEVEYSASETLRQPVVRSAPRSAFTLDTSGIVYPMEPRVEVPGGAANAVMWTDLDPFTQGYVEALFASLRSSDPRVVEVLARRRLSLDQDAALLTTIHWSRAALWPSTREEMENLGLVKVVARAGGGTVTEPTELGRLAATHTIGFSDLSPEALAAIMGDCARYQRSEIAELCNGAEGRWFWHARNLRDDLKDFPPLTVSLGDDGKVSLTPAHGAHDAGTLGRSGRES